MKPRYRFVGRDGADYLFLRQWIPRCDALPRIHRIPIASFWRAS